MAKPHLQRGTVLQAPHTHTWATTALARYRAGRDTTTTALARYRAGRDTTTTALARYRAGRDTTPDEW